VESHEQTLVGGLDGTVGRFCSRGEMASRLLPVVARALHRGHGPPHLVSWVRCRSAELGPAVPGHDGVAQRLTEELVDHLLRLSGGDDPLADEVRRALGDGDDPPGPAPARAG
jgi:hypothetical protein